MFGETLLDEEAPKVVSFVEGVAGAVFAGDALGAAMERGDVGQGLHFDEAVELARFEADAVTDVGEGGLVEQGGGGEGGFAAGFAGGGEGEGGVDGEGAEGGVVGAEMEEVVEVAEVVEGFVGVFDGEFSDGRVGQGVDEHGCVEVGAVAGALIGGEDDELGDAAS